MTSLRKLLRPLAALAAACGTAAMAAGPGASDSVGELSLTGSQLGMLFGGAAVLGVVIWLLIRLLGRE